MIILALDTALAATSIAVTTGDQVLAVRTEPMARGHQERLAGLVRATMQEAGAAFDQLDRIGVTVGPGSFTGLRVGLAFAKGLALALKIPCVGVGTLEALAQSDDVEGLKAAVIDARRDQVYLQLFHQADRLTEPQALTLEDARAVIAQRAGAQPLALIGSGAPGLAIPGARVDARAYPEPLALARLTHNAPEPISKPAPLYLRAPDAKTIAERAAG